MPSANKRVHGLTGFGGTGIGGLGWFVVRTVPFHTNPISPPPKDSVKNQLLRFLSHRHVIHGVVSWAKVIWPAGGIQVLGLPSHKTRLSTMLSATFTTQYVWFVIRHHSISTRPAVPANPGVGLPKDTLPPAPAPYPLGDRALACVPPRPHPYGGCPPMLGPQPPG